jgi:hypothetical protein
MSRACEYQISLWIGRSTDCVERLAYYGQDEWIATRFAYKCLSENCFTLKKWGNSLERILCFVCSSVQFRARWLGGTLGGQ